MVHPAVSDVTREILAELPAHRRETFELRLEQWFPDLHDAVTAVYPDPDRKNGYLVMTEVLNAAGTPHVSNGRATIDVADDDEDFWFGFEQEYFLWDPETDLPPGFPRAGYPRPQGPYYCSVGAKNAYGREVIEEHLDQCLEAGLNVEGINGEVAAGHQADRSRRTPAVAGDRR